MKNSVSDSFLFRLQILPLFCDIFLMTCISLPDTPFVGPGGEDWFYPGQSDGEVREFAEETVRPEQGL